MDELGASLFSGCTQLHEVTIPDSITVIGNEAFRDCTSLTNIVVPEGITSMGTSVFSGCSSLSKVILPQSLASTGWGIFDDCPSLVTAGPSKGDYNYNIQFGWINEIPTEAFWNCSSLTTITLPNSIRKIGNNAFYGTSISDVYFLGTPAEWGAVSNNQEVGSARIHYNDPSVGPTPTTSTVSYDLNGGTGTTPFPQTYVTGATVTVTSHIPTKDNTKFIGWSDGNTTYQAGAQFNAPDYDVVLTAQWESTIEINNEALNLKQPKGSVICPLVSATMMLRCRAILDGNANWTSITTEKVKVFAWTNQQNNWEYSGAIRSSFIYRDEQAGIGMSIKRSQNIEGSQKSVFIDLLKEHPEGIVIWDAEVPHAVLLTDYDPQNDIFYCADPVAYIPTGRIPLKDSYLAQKIGKSDEKILAAIDRFWYVSDHNNNIKTIETITFRSHCPVEMLVSTNGITLDSRDVTDRVSSGHVTMSVSGFGQDRSVTTIVKNYIFIENDMAIKLLGTDTGSMVFTAEYLYTDGTKETHIFQNISITPTTIGTATEFYPHSTLILTFDDSQSVEKWATDPDETATRPSTDFETGIPGPDFLTYTVTFDANNGTVIPTTSTTDVEGKLPHLPVPTRNGYTFNGWYTANGTRITTNTVFTKDTIVYASWSKTDTPTVPSYSSGSSLDSNPMYSIAVPNRVTGGTVKVTPTSSSKGQRITITVSPNVGYELDTLTVTDAKGNTLSLTSQGNGKYTFIMPNSKVNIEAAFSPVKTSKPISFTDVPSSAYYYNAVVWAVENDITAGTSATTFSPDSPCTRAQIVTFLWRAAGSPSVGGNNSFTDVAPGSYYYDAVQWAVAQGITVGTSATTFSPDATCTRGQTVTFLYRYEKSPAVSGGDAFADVDADAYYANAVQWAVAQGVTAGTSATTFSPDTTCTRSQIVTFLYRDMA